MAGSYQIQLRNAAGGVVAIIDDYRSLDIQKTVNEVGSLTLLMSGLDAKVPLFETDGQIIVYRRDMQYGIPWYEEWSGFVRKLSFEQGDDGDQTLTINAVTFNNLLARRIIAYPAGVSQTVKSDAAETVMKEFVIENCGTDALFVNGRLRDGLMLNFTVEADGAAGPTWDGQRSYKTVLEVLKEINEATLMEYDVIMVGTSAFEFRTYYPQRGYDLTTTGLSVTTGLNSAGNAPVIFNPLLGNVLSMEYTDDRLEEKTVAISAGQGTGEERNIEITVSAASIDSPYNDIEGYDDSRNITETDQLVTAGAGFLKENQQKQTFTVKPIQTNTSAYGLNYYWGDMVTAQYGTEITLNKRIITVSISVQEGEESIELEFADKL